MELVCVSDICLLDWNMEVTHKMTVHVIDYVQC
jgi:hypothetical protein